MAYRYKPATVTASQMREEGAFEVGGVPGTSVLFVRTGRGLRLFHVDRVPDRELDAYGIANAISRLETGFSAVAVARQLGIDPCELGRQLKDTGYERKSMIDGGPRKGGRARFLAARAGKRVGAMIKQKTSAKIRRQSFVPTRAGTR